MADYISFLALICSAIVGGLLFPLSVLYRASKALLSPVYELSDRLPNFLKCIIRHSYAIYRMLYMIADVFFNILYYHFKWSLSILLLANTTLIQCNILDNKNIWLSAVLGYYLLANLLLRFLRFFNFVLMVWGLVLFVSWRIHNRTLLEPILSLGAFGMRIAQNFAITTFLYPERISNPSNYLKLLLDSTKLAK